MNEKQIRNRIAYEQLSERQKMWHTTKFMFRNDGIWGVIKYFWIRRGLKKMIKNAKD